MLTVEGFPLLLRGPRGAGSRLVDVSFDACWESVARAIDGEAFARNAVGGTIDGARGLYDGP